MKRVGVVAVAVIALVLTLPVSAYAIDHVVLHVKPTRLASSGSLRSWSLEASTVQSFSPLTSSTELLGVTLRHRSLKGRAEESHAFRAAPVHTLTFDGARGRWETALGGRLTIRMTIAAAGAGRAEPELLGCRGAFVRIPVVLRGTFRLPTGTKAFKTVRRTRLAAEVTYNSGGPVSCESGLDDQCSPTSSFGASTRTGARLLASSDLGGWLSLAFADAPTTADAVWYHVMLLTHFDPFSGGLPALTVGVPAQLPIQGGGLFTASTTSSTPRGNCTETNATGTFDGVFRTRFTGWGSRTFTAHGDDALYSESR